MSESGFVDTCNKTWLFCLQLLQDCQGKGCIRCNPSITTFTVELLFESGDKCLHNNDSNASVVLPL